MDKSSVDEVVRQQYAVQNDPLQVSVQIWFNHQFKIRLQIKQFNEPIEVKITEWNTGGLITRIEGLRGFLPKVELVNRVTNFTELKENVGRRLYVQITRITLHRPRLCARVQRKLEQHEAIGDRIFIQQQSCKN